MCGWVHIYIVHLSIQAGLAMNCLELVPSPRPTVAVLSVSTRPPSPYMVYGRSLRTQIPTLTGHAGTRHTTTSTNGERRKNQSHDGKGGGSRKFVQCTEHMQKARAAGALCEAEGCLPGVQLASPR